MPNKKKLVLVVGAGASSEANLPVGEGLKKDIERALNFRFEAHQQVSGDEIITDALKTIALVRNQLFPDPAYLFRAAHRIHNAMPQASSIDNFIDSHKSDTDIAVCGKLAIARCILQAEGRSLLNFDSSNTRNRMNFELVAQKWYGEFFKLLTENCEVSDLSDRLSQIGIVCFNYDRCIEHYLYWSLQNYYGITSQAAENILVSLEIHHPYGKVGELPWQNQSKGFPFGGDPHPQKLIALAKELRTFTEGTDPAVSDIEVTRNMLTSADQIVFLGFAFHRLNLDLLFPRQPNGTKAMAKTVIGTATKISDSNLELIKSELISHHGLSPKQMHLRSDLQCAELFSEYWRALSVQ